MKRDVIVPVIDNGNDNILAKTFADVKRFGQVARNPKDFSEAQLRNTTILWPQSNAVLKSSHGSQRY
jgi:hypothetical protein